MEASQPAVYRAGKFAASSEMGLRSFGLQPDRHTPGVRVSRRGLSRTVRQGVNGTRKTRCALPEDINFGLMNSRSAGAGSNHADSLKLKELLQPVGLAQDGSEDVPKKAEKTRLN